MLAPIAPANIALIGNELAIAWSDQEESYLKLETLRKHCPCARCGGGPDLLNPAIRSTAPTRPESFRLRSYHIAGGYALQLVWEDGHDTGLYSYRFLRELAHV